MSRLDPNPSAGPLTTILLALAFAAIAGKMMGAW